MPKRATNRAPSRQPAPAADSESWWQITNLAGQTPEIRFIGIIGQPTEYYDYWEGRMVQNSNAAGTFEEFLEELDELGDVPELVINISSPGGDYSTGVAIHDRLLRHPATKTCIIDGECSSAATYIALACDSIQMPANARMMIHRASTGVYGNVEELQAAIDMLAWIDSNIADLYAARCGREVEEMLTMMTNNTQFNGQQALDIGLIDEVLPGVMKKPAKTASNIRVMNFAAVPAARALFDTAQQAKANNQRNQSPSPSSSPMLKNQTPLMAPADDAGGSSGAPTPAAPATPPAPAAPTAAPETPPAPAAAPVSNGPAAAPDIAAIVTAAVSNAVKPLQERLDVIEGQRRAGIENLGGSAPAPVEGGAAPEAPKKVVSNLGAFATAWKPAAKQ